VLLRLAVRALCLLVHLRLNVSERIHELSNTNRVDYLLSSGHSDLGSLIQVCGDSTSPFVC